MAALSSIVSGVKPETLITYGCYSAEKVSPVLARAHFVCCSSVASFIFLFILAAFRDFAPVDHLCDVNYGKVSQADALTDSDFSILKSSCAQTKVRGQGCICFF